MMYCVQQHNFSAIIQRKTLFLQTNFEKTNKILKYEKDY